MAGALPARWNRIVKIGLLAGSGRLPIILRERVTFHYCLDLATWPRPLGAVQAICQTMKQAGCEALCLAGAVDRQRFHDLDEGGAWVAQRAGPEAGDGQLLDALIAYFEQQGFKIRGAGDVSPSLRTPAGVLTGALSFDPTSGLVRARTLGQQDVGQAVIHCGETLWLYEDAAGTNTLIKRAGEIPAAVKTLFKAAKPQQDLRVDMPTWGPETVRAAAQAGVRTLIFEAEKTLALDLDEALEQARHQGLTIVGVAP